MRTQAQRPTLALWSLLLLLLTVSLTAQAQRQVDLLVVQVVNADGSPAANVRVLIESDTCASELPYSSVRGTDARGMALDTVAAFRCNLPGRYWVTIIDCNGNRVRREVIIGRTPMPVRFVYCRTNPEPARCAARFDWRENNASVSFVNRSEPANTRLQYVWDFGDGNRSSEANPTHHYARPGRYEVCLTVATADGCRDRSCQWVSFGDTTTPNPTRCKAEFAIRPTNNAGNSFNFINQSVGENLRVQWSFGDGSGSDETNPIHVYTRPGTYRVCLTVASARNTNTGCYDSTCQSLTVRIPDTTQPTRCQAAFAIRPADNVGGFSFVNQSAGDNLQYVWDFGDGNRSNEANPRHLYARPGTYRVCLVVVSRTSNTSRACTDTTCQTVNVPPAPSRCQANFEIHQRGTSFAFVNRSEPANTRMQYVWSFGDGNRSTAVNPTYSYVRPGRYEVCLTLSTPEGCTSTACQWVSAIDTTTPPPARCKAAFAMRPANNAGNAFSFVNQSQGDNLRLQWSFGDGNRSDEANPTHTYTRPGTYLVCLTVTSRQANAATSCVDSTCQVVTIQPQPARCKADFEVRERSTGFAFVNRSVPANTRLQYVWSFGDGNRSTAVNPTHTYARPGRYEVCLTVTTPEGCTDTKCQWVSTANNPNPVDSTLSTICVNVRLSDGRTPADSYTVILYRLDPATNRWMSVDTLLGPAANTPNGGPVCFTNLPAGQYIALGQLTPRSQHRASHIRTYYDRSQTWRNAQIIDTRRPSSRILIDLVLLPRLNTSGPARTSGRAAAPGKTSSVGVGAWVLAVNVATHETVALAETDAEGRYTLDGLPYGTYRILAEAVNFHDRPVVVTLSPEAPVAQADITLSEEPAPTGRSPYLNFGDLTLYPNPSTGLVWVKAPWLTGETVQITVLGTDGRVLRQHDTSATEAIDLSDLPQGLYLLRVVQGQHAATRSLLLN